MNTTNKTNDTEFLHNKMLKFIQAMLSQSQDGEIYIEDVDVVLEDFGISKEELEFFLNEHIIL
ncbi:MAG: hypothetical protein K6F37_02600 [Lachnospiraceae bacterium]|nr:hypothetical protein [Lachnospiraceae bacterium]